MSSVEKTNSRSLPPDEVLPQSPLVRRLTSSRLWITVFSVGFTAVFLAIFIPAYRRHRALAYIHEHQGVYELTAENWMSKRFGDIANGFRGVDDVRIDHTTDDALAHLATLSEVTRLYCGEDEMQRTVLSSHGIESLKCLVDLEEVGFSGSQFTDELLADYFSSRPRLRSVKLWGTQAGRMTLVELTRLHSIEELSLSGTRFANEDLLELDSLSKLETVSISNCQLPISGAEWLSQCTRLRVLHLNGTEVTDAALAQLSTLPALEVLSLADSSQVTELGIEHITALSQLKILRLPSHVVTYRTVDLLRQVPSLIEVTRSGSIVDEDLRTYFFDSWPARTTMATGTP